ncbi:MAG: hypothetical protein H8D23_16000 [Candidatus Brocadiales bacterium]|nr:hypothetical protein [Candidatus Brocadiales bacterium]
MVRLIFKLHCIFFLLVFTTPVSGNDIEIGQIIEVSQSREYIQVNDHIFKVNHVQIDDGTENLQEGHRQQLNEGGIVQIIIGKTKTVDYWEAETVVLYTGEKQKKVILGMEKDIPEIQEKDSTAPSQYKIEQKNSSPIIFKNGVWHN